MINSEQTGEILGEDKVVGFQARIVYCVRENIQGSGLNQIMLGGVGLTPETIDYNEDGHWEMMECDVIIIPKNRKVIKGNSIVKNGRIDQVMLNLSNDKDWEEIETY